MENLILDSREDSIIGFTKKIIELKKENKEEAEDLSWDLMLLSE